MGARNMQSECEEIEEVFQLILEASEKLWEAVAALHEKETTFSNSLVQPLMQMRGDIHVNLLRPMYMKFPELGTKFGLDGDP